MDTRKTLSTNGKFGIIKRLNITNVEMGFGKNSYYISGKR